MSNKVLVTDSLFIFDDHIKQLKQAGFEVERLDKPDAGEDELCEAVKDKVGYILGGIERVNEKIIDAANELKAIAVLGIGYQWFVPAWEYATKKGIAITNTPDGPTQQVAEWAMTACLMMNREFLSLGLAGDKQFAVTKGIASQRVGIIGLGRIGRRIAEMLQPFKPSSLVYWSRTPKSNTEAELGIHYADLDSLLKGCDIIFVCLADDAKNFIGDRELKLMKRDALLVNITHPGIIDEEALLEDLKQGRIRAISDYPMMEEFNSLPSSTWYSMKTSNTITEAGTRLMSNMSTQSLINILKTGDDQYLVNPGYRK